jgi:signal transduction histidine kinase
MDAVSRLTSRGLGTVLLLSIALVATSLLAWQAYGSAAAHRRATEAVLCDYAGLAAAELVRRGANEVGYRGFYVLLQALTDSKVSPARLETSVDPALRRAGPLLRGTLVADLSSRDVTFSKGADPSAASWLAGKLAAPSPGYPYLVLQGLVGGEPRMFVLGPPRGRRSTGYEVAQGALAPFIAAAIDHGALLPPSLGRGTVSNARLAITVRDAGGGVRYRRGAGWGGRFRVQVPFGDTYSGALQGFTAEVEIDPSAAQELVIGGLPASRLPAVLALLGLAVGLLVAAVLQVGRERALEAMRSEFVASASHELRTPLTQIRMFAETLRLGRARSEEERLRSLEIIDRESQRLARLVDNLLFFSRLGRTAPALRRQMLEAAAPVTEVVESFRPVAAVTDSRIACRVLGHGRISVDPDAWRQVLLNLLDNALKYGPRGQEIEVTLEVREGMVLLTVEDEGPGIPPQDRERVFERFQRLERDRASAVAGTGIGLAVVRELVSLHGGCCRVETGLRGGARVVVQLPGIVT